MSLREEIARRLGGIKWPALLTTNECVADMEVDAAQGNGATWGDMADECIRQMEYARRQTFDSVRDYLPDVEVHEPLSAAPEGWKP